MTEAMTAIYAALGDLMASCVKELRGSNKIDAGELRLEDGLFRAFDDIVRRQLDAVWHTVSPRTKQASAGFKELRASATTHFCVPVLICVADCVILTQTWKQPSYQQPATSWMWFGRLSGQQASHERTSTL